MTSQQTPPRAIVGVAAADPVAAAKEQSGSALRQFELRRAHDRKDNSTSWLCLLIAVVIFVPLYLYMFYLRYSDYILDMDEPALISHTVNAPAREWFTQGFSSYFLIYPEWTSPNSNFLRPVVQLVVYLCNLAFGENYKFYYLVYYLTAIAILFGLLRVLKLCSVSWLNQLVSGLLWALGPAFLGLGLVSIAFMFDLFAALICFAAFWACVQERYFVASLLLIGAVLTKETTLYAPLAAAATALFFNRADLRRGAAFAGLLVTPLALWAALRWNAFGTLLGGSTGLGDSQPIGPVTWVVGLATWPTGRSSLSGLAAAFHGDFAHPELLEGLAFLAINTFVWLTIALGARNASRRDPSDLEGRIYPAVWIWLLASLGFVILTGMSAPRYGSSTFIFLIIALALMTSDTRSRLARVSGICALAGLGVGTLSYDYHAFSSAFPEMPPRWETLRAFSKALAGLDQDGKRVLVVNAPAIYLNPKYESESLHLRKEIVFVNQWEREESCGAPRPDAVAAETSALEVTKAMDGRRGYVIRLPPCYKFSFVNAKEAFEGMENHSYSVERKGVGLYTFPHAKILREKLRGGHVYSFGDQLNFYPEDPSTAVLAYDVGSEKFTLPNHDSR